MQEINPFECFRHEQNEWAKFVSEKIGKSARLFQIIDGFGKQRIYKLGDVFFKIHKTKVRHNEEAVSLQNEYKFLSRFSGLLNIQNLDYQTQDGWEFISYYFPASDTLNDLIPTLSFRAKTNIMLQALIILLVIDFQGVACRNIGNTNIVIRKSGKLTITNFGHAIHTNFLKAIWIDFFKGDKKRGSVAFLKLCLSMLLPKKIIFAINRLKGFLLRFCKKIFRLKQRDSMALSSERDGVKPDIEKIIKAWWIVASPTKDSPEGNMPYYSITIENHKFHGDRPWDARWNDVSKIVDFRSKKIIDLGCNVGLFGIFSGFAGAKEYTGVEYDSKAIQAARLISEAFKFKHEFYQLDFNSDIPWEKYLPNADLAISLSILNWIKNKGRFLRFLGKYPELLYEGHDSDEIEKARLRAVGFNQITKISTTDRGKGIFIARK